MEVKREHFLILGIDSDADVGVCRRKSVALASQLGFDDVKTGEVAILVSEMVTNVLKHGGGRGKISIGQLTDESGRKAIEIVCCDGGNGIRDIEKAIGDGFTEKDSLGIGLGTIRRFSDIFEVNPAREITDALIESTHLFKHCLRVVKWVPNLTWKGTNRNLLIGAVSHSKPGEMLNGDCFVVSHISHSKTIAAVVDGLGHGKDANIASSIVKEQILLKGNLPVEELVRYIHQATKGTRGAVIGLLLIDTEKGTLHFTGVGNIEGFVHSGDDKKSLISFGGILGHQIRTPRVYEYPFKPGDVICLYSDGLNSRWNPKEINWKEHPQKIAENLVSQYSRLNDDTTVLIISHIA
jgi:anti-sigma regulatory factor (Ser/Thr protein kinase)